MDISLDFFADGENYLFLIFGSFLDILSIKMSFFDTKITFWITKIIIDLDISKNKRNWLGEFIIYKYIVSIANTYCTINYIILICRKLFVITKSIILIKTGGSINFGDPSKKLPKSYTCRIVPNNL